MELRVILTGEKTYTPIEVIDIFGEYLSNRNTAILTDHLIYEDLATQIQSFFEDENGDLNFNLINGETLRVKSNDENSEPLFTEKLLLEYLSDNYDNIQDKLKELDQLKASGKKGDWQVKTNALIKQVSNNDFRVLKWGDIYRLIRKNVKY